MSADAMETDPASTGKLIVASNRGPVSWSQADDGSWTPSRGAGGLIVALGGALQERPGTWVSVALEDGDREMSAAHDGQAFTADTGQGRFTLRLVDVGEVYDDYYNKVANRLLWFTLHQLWSEPYYPLGDGWTDAWAAYQDVNRQVAEAVVAEAGDDPTPEIHLQDYHLLTAAPHIRAAIPGARILHYIHTPWVHPTYFRRLPDPMVTAILDGLVACDVVGLSASEWTDTLRSCLVQLGGCPAVEPTPDGTWVASPRGRLLLKDFTLGIDADSLAEVAASDAAIAERDALVEQVGDRQLIVRADRTDLSKNILRGLVAYDLLLQRRPDLVDRVHFRALLNPSRQGVPEYREYLQRCIDLGEEIRGRHGEAVLEIDVDNSFPRVVAAMQSYDVLLTNPVIDGTNLVAKEGPALNERDGVLVLSRNAGAADTMTDAVFVNPFDVEQTVDALEHALEMGAEERARRAAALKDAASSGTPADWLSAQRRALDVAVGD